MRWKLTVGLKTLHPRREFEQLALAAGVEAAGRKIGVLLEPFMVPPGDRLDGLDLDIVLVTSDILSEPVGEVTIVDLGCDSLSEAIRRVHTATREGYLKALRRDVRRFAGQWKAASEFTN
jgi:hypothetical protein